MPMGFADRLKAARQHVKLTLSEVSSATGIGTSSLSEFENGKREPSLSQLGKLAKLYERAVSYFFETTPAPAQGLLLWRNKPDSPQDQRIQARFERLCGQFRNLEIWTSTPKSDVFGKLFCEGFPTSFTEVEGLAHEIWKRMALGERPGESLLRILEEVYGVKIFHLALESEASSACTWSEEFGPAILLNRNNRPWRRNFDLAHELFHLVTWHARAASNDIATAREESFANTFASRLLMPDEPFRDAIQKVAGKDGRIAYDDLDSVARQFGVSLDALFWRLGSIYSIPQSEVKRLIAQAKAFSSLPPRSNDEPSEYPTRYCALAVRALRHGEISSSKFASYLGINLSEVDRYTANVPKPVKIPASYS